MRNLRLRRHASQRKLCDASPILSYLVKAVISNGHVCHQACNGSCLPGHFKVGEWLWIKMYPGLQSLSLFKQAGATSRPHTAAPCSDASGLLLRPMTRRTPPSSEAALRAQATSCPTKTAILPSASEPRASAKTHRPGCGISVHRFREFGTCARSSTRTLQGASYW